MSHGKQVCVSIWENVEIGQVWQEKLIRKSWVGVVIQDVQLEVATLQVAQGEIQGLHRLGPDPPLLLLIYPGPQVARQVDPSKYDV